MDYSLTGQISKQSLAEYVAAERRGDEVMRRFHRVYGWKSYVYPVGLRWYGIRMLLSDLFSVSDDASVALFRLEAHFLGLDGEAREREHLRLDRLS